MLSLNFFIITALWLNHRVKCAISAVNTPVEFEVLLPQLEEFLASEGWGISKTMVIDGLGEQTGNAGMFIDGLVVIDADLSVTQKLKTTIHELRHYNQFEVMKDREVFEKAKFDLFIGRVSYENAYHEVDAREQEELMYKRFMEYRRRA